MLLCLAFVLFLTNKILLCIFYKTHCYDTLPDSFSLRLFSLSHSQNLIQLLCRAYSRITFFLHSASVTYKYPWTFLYTLKNHFHSTTHIPARYSSNDSSLLRLLAHSLCTFYAFVKRFANVLYAARHNASHIFFLERHSDVTPRAKNFSRPSFAPFEIHSTMRAVWIMKCPHCFRNCCIRFKIVGNFLQACLSLHLRCISSYQTKVKRMKKLKKIFCPCSLF